MWKQIFGFEIKLKHKIFWAKILQKKLEGGEVDYTKTLTIRVLQWAF